MNDYLSIITDIVPQNIKKIIEKHIALFVSFIVTFVSCTFYCLGYLFVYGFYFSGASARRYSLLDIVVNPIPLEFKSTIVIAILFLISVILFLLIIKSLKINKLLTVFMFIGIHFLLAAIFIGFGNDNNFEDILLFCLVWVLPLIVFEMISFTKVLETTGALIIISSFCYIFNITIFIIVILTHFNAFDTLNSLFFILFVLFLFITPKILKLIITAIKYRTGLMVICFSIVNMFIIIMAGIIFYAMKPKLSIFMFFLPAIISLIIAYILSGFISSKKILINNISINSQMPSSKNNLEIFKTITSKNRYLSTIILISVILFCFSIAFYGSIILGHTVRMSIFNIPSDLIKYSSCGKINEIRGTIVCKKDGICYISTEDFNLKTVKTDNFQATDILSIRDDIKSSSYESWIEKINYSNIYSGQLDDDIELELVVFMNQKLLLLDRDYSGVKDTCFLDDVIGFSINNKIITVSTIKGPLKYSLLNNSFNILK